MVISNGNGHHHDPSDLAWEDEDDTEDSGALPPLPSLTEGSFSLSGGVGGANTEADLFRRFAFSAIMASEQQITFDYLIDFVSKAHLELPEEREAMEGVIDLFWWVFSADCTNRQGRIDELEKQCDYWVARMEKEDEQTAADALVNEWGTQAAKQLNLKVRKARFGFTSIDTDEDYQVWVEAERAMVEADIDATKLTAAAFQYYLGRVGQLNIQAERVMDAARGISEVDYTPLKNFLQTAKHVKGKDILHRMPWPFRRAFTRGRGSKADGVFDANHLEAMLAGMMMQHTGAGFQGKAPLVSIGTAETPPPVQGGEKNRD